MSKGKFISIEGIEGAGKSTAIIFIKEYFSRLSKEMIATREPGGSSLAEKIRELLLYSVQETMYSETELLLMFASRTQHIQQLIKPALIAGKYVVSDRFIDASYAYQGGGREIALHKIAALDNLFVGNLYPDLTLLLDISAEQGLARTEKRNQAKDRIEEEKLDFFLRVREVYLNRAKEDPNRIKIIDASLELSLVQKQIQTILNEFLL
jgi:dTMP kinase